ncbi:MAG: adenylate/guanylate cyclase domain-containing protein, partial [Spirochaetales bacterium]|nr:adenylate/guanylate cyclase domain-containing protein [Spirochaetales bacterium]
MIRNQKDGKPGDKDHIVILFTDIRGFTQFSDQAEPELVINRLNQILDVQSNIVEKYNGDVDKFMGDAVMAQFINPLDAVKAGVEMVRVVEKLTEDWDYPLHIGVGLNYGEVVAGNIGSHNRKEFAVIGDTVNLASRLCSVAPAKSVIISESLYSILGNKLMVKPIKNQKIKGKADLITYYAIKKIRLSND